MKQVKFLSILLLSIVTATSIQAQTVDEVIAKYITAMGGKDKLLALTSTVMQASLSVQGQDIPVTISQVHNKGQRAQFTIMGMENYTIMTPTEGWMYFPIQGQTKPEAMPAAAVKEGVDLLDIQSPLLNYKEKGHQLELLGKEDVEGTECFKLKLKMKGGAEQTIFIDPVNYYILKTISKSKATGQEVEQTQTFSNYKKLDSGYVFPFAFTGNAPGEIVVSKIEVNVPVDEKLFKAN
jgi:hypothetical protein